MPDDSSGVDVGTGLLSDGRARDSIVSFFRLYSTAPAWERRATFFES